MPVLSHKRVAETNRAGDGIRTHDNDVGNVVLYQLSYTRLMKYPRLSTASPAGHLAQHEAALRTITEVSQL